MSALRVLASLDRLRSRAPATVAATARFVSKAALTNARRSIAEITGAVEERRSVLLGLDDGHAPGDLVRLTPSQCQELLTTKSVGRLAYVARPGVPDIVPVNYAMAGEAILVRSAPGPKLQAAERRELVAFEVDEIDEATHTGWSIVVVGVARRVPTTEGPGPRPEPWASGTRRYTIRIEPRRIDGRQLL